MHDPRLGLWSVVVSEWAVRAAPYVSAEAYDQYGPWHLPLRLRAAISRLNLRISLWDQTSADELNDVLEFIDCV